MIFIAFLQRIESELCSTGHLRPVRDPAPGTDLATPASISGVETTTASDTHFVVCSGCVNAALMRPFTVAGTAVGRRARRQGGVVVPRRTLPFSWWLATSRCVCARRLRSDPRIRDVRWSQCWSRTPSDHPGSATRATPSTQPREPHETKGYRIIPGLVIRSRAGVRIPRRAPRLIVAFSRRRLRPQRRISRSRHRGS